MRLLVVMMLAACSRSNDVAALRFEASAIAAFHQPTLDDVFLAKTGRTLEGSEAE